MLLIDGSTGIYVSVTQTMCDVSHTHLQTHTHTHTHTETLVFASGTSCSVESQTQRRVRIFPLHLLSLKLKDRDRPKDKIQSAQEKKAEREALLKKSLEEKEKAAAQIAKVFFFSTYKDCFFLYIYRPPRRLPRYVFFLYVQRFFLSLYIDIYVYIQQPAAQVMVLSW